MHTQVYQLSSFRDPQARTPLSGERHRDAAHECLEAALRVSRCSAPLNREVMYVCMHVCMCVCMYACVYVCMYACKCVCMYV